MQTTSATLSKAFIAATCMATLAACGSKPPAPPQPASVKAVMQASAGSNPDHSGRGSPLVVRVYRLKSAVAFDAAGFGELYERDQAVLGADLQGRDEFVLRPGETLPWDRTLDADVRAIGVVAAFRDIDKAHWKAVLSIQDHAVNLVTLQVDGVSLSSRVAVAPPARK